MPDLVLPRDHAIVALGANLDDREAALRGAVEALAAAAVEPVALSRLYDTEPVGPPQPRFLNAAVRLRTVLPPEALLALLLDVERAFGRDRSRELRHGPRRLDLDLLLHTDAVCSTPTLTLPHPRMFDRAFVLAPLADLMPGAGRVHVRLAELGGPPPVVAWRRPPRVDGVALRSDPAGDGT